MLVAVKVVSIRNKDRFKEEEIGLVTLPLEDVINSEPQYFRCRDTNKVGAYPRLLPACLYACLSVSCLIV